VDLQADPVAEAVAEVLAVPGRRDDLARCGVDRAALRPRTHRGQPRLLGAQHESVGLREGVRQVPHGRPGARAVRVVAVQARADVERHQRVGRDLDRCRLGVRQRAALGRGHDRGKARAVGAQPPHLLLEREGDGALRAAGQALLAQDPVDLVGQRRGGADALDLLGLLDGAQALDQPARRHELDPLGQQLAQARVAADGHVVVLEAEPQLALRPARPQGGDEVLRALLAVEALDLGGRPLDVAEVGDEAAHVAPRHRHAVRAGEAGQVAQVDEVRDEQQVELAGGQAPASRSARVTAPP
jgi:hypothetical protein